MAANSAMNATIEDFLQYLRVEKNYSGQTVETYRKALSEYEDYVTATQGTFDPLAPSLDLARGWMVDMGKRRMAAATVKKNICALRSLCKYLRRKGKLTSNPLVLLPTPKVAKSLPTWVREDQMDSLIDNTPFEPGFIGMRDHLLIDMLYSTGMRRGEAAGLCCKDVDMDNCTIRVVGKGNKERLIPFGPELADLLRQYMQAKDETLGRPTERLLTDREGRPITPNTVTALAHKYLERVPDLSRRGAHVFRHSFATNMLSEGADLMAVKELLGHASLDSTEVYTHITPQELLQNYRKAHPRGKE